MLKLCEKAVGRPCPCGAGWPWECDEVMTSMLAIRQVGAELPSSDGGAVGVCDARRCHSLIAQAHGDSAQCRVSREITRSRTREVGFTLGLSSTVRGLAPALAVILHPSRGSVPFGRALSGEFPPTLPGMLLFFL